VAVVFEPYRSLPRARSPEEDRAHRYGYDAGRTAERRIVPVEWAYTLRIRLRWLQGYDEGLHARRLIDRKG
jgi:ribosome modulation factor